MSTIIETDLKEVLTNISNKIDRLLDEVNSLKLSVAKDINEVKVEIATVKEGQNGINKRLDNLDFIARTVIAGVVVALLAGLAKILYPNLIS